MLFDEDNFLHHNNRWIPLYTTVDTDMVVYRVIMKL